MREDLRKDVQGGSPAGPDANAVEEVRALKEPFDAKKLFCSEILAIIQQDTQDTQVAVLRKFR